MWNKLIFLKWTSERGKSDREQLWIWIIPSLIDFESILKFIIQFQSCCMSDPPLSGIDFKKNDLSLTLIIIRKPIASCWIFAKWITSLLDWYKLSIQYPSLSFNIKYCDWRCKFRSLQFSNRQFIGFFVVGISTEIANRIFWSKLTSNSNKW